MNPFGMDQWYGKKISMNKKSNFVMFFTLPVFILMTFFSDLTSARISKGMKKASRFNVVAAPAANLVWQSATDADPIINQSPNTWVFESGYSVTDWTIGLSNSGTATSGTITVEILGVEYPFAILLDGCTGAALSPTQACMVTVTLFGAGMMYGTVNKTLRATANGVSKDINLYACDVYTC